MDALNFFYLNVSADKSFNQTSLSKVKLIMNSTDGAKPPLETQPHGALLLVLASLCFIIVWAVIIFSVSNVWKLARNGKLTSYSFKQVPCEKCRFFKNNNYLKCAVHPTTVLTKQALNCPDYQPLKRYSLF